MKLYIRCSDTSIRTISSLDALRDELESGNYAYYGLRGAYVDDLNLLSRGYLDVSYEWVDGEASDEQLGGTCALGVSEWLSDVEILRRYRRVSMYGDSGVVLLIADSAQEYGVDENEVILGHGGYGADVVAIVKL